MKVQCSCGTKYSFDVTPEMAQNPMQVVCQNCGRDISSFINDLVLHELQATEAVATPPPPPPPPLPESAPPPAAPTALRVRINTQPKAEPAAAWAADMPICLKHSPARTTHKCLICQKPICPQCMHLFGYVCSPLCREKAELRGVKIPVFEGERSRVEARHWRKVGLAAAGVALVIAGLIGLYAWYVFVGCLPRPYFAVRFDKPAHSGQSAFCEKGQIVFIHGATLARYDTKQNKQVWSRQLVNRKEIEERQAGTSLTADEFEEYLGWAMSGCQLKVVGHSIWIVEPGKMKRYDWDTGELKQEVPLIGGSEAVVQQDEVQIIGSQPGNRSITHISFADGQQRVEEIRETVVNSKPHQATFATARISSHQPFGGSLKSTSGKNLSAPLDPAKVAEQVQSLSYPARITLPATLSSALEQERIMAEINDQNGAAPSAAPANPELTEEYALIPLKDGCLQFSVRLLERKMVTTVAMKERPKKSALDSVKATDTRAVANEIFNEMQRDRGTDKVTEDKSRYWVTLRRADEKVQSEWIGEVVGPPGVIPLETVNVLAAGNTIRVFSKANKKLWEATLTFNVPLHNLDAGGEESVLGAGPCVEHAGTLYVADQGVLTAFNLANGEARWRLPSVGVTGMYFDDKSMLYVNATTANLDSIKYSRQIDVGQQIDAVLLKINPKTGKTLWSTKPGGALNYISGKYLYVVLSYRGDLDENGEVPGIQTGLERAAFVRIKRLNPDNGQVIWNYQQTRCPLDVKFHDNTIQLVFRKEVQALKFWTF